MAVIPAQITGPSNKAGYLKVLWANMANGDTGGPVRYPEFPDKTVQVTGTFGAGGAVTMQGSNDGGTYGALHNTQGATLALSNSEPTLIVDNPEFMYPEVTGGDGTTSLDVTVIMVP